MRCRGGSTVSSARRRQTGTNLKWKVATAWSCWPPRHHPSGTITGAGSNPAPVVFLATGEAVMEDRVLDCAILRSDFRAHAGRGGGFSRWRPIADERMLAVELGLL